MNIRPAANIEPGMVFERLTIIGLGDRLKNGTGTCCGWLCQCECGKTTTVNSSNLLNRGTISCGCAGAAKTIPIGTKVGYLMVIGVGEHQIRADGYGGATSQCRCKCGVEIDFLNTGLRRKKRLSCGCKTTRWYGENFTPEWHALKAAIQRCHNPSHPSWDDYGGRGITVCDEWRRDYRAFLACVGRRPSSRYSLDRFPDNDGNYEPDNVRWRTAAQQARNKRNNRILAFDGIVQALTDWASLRGWSDNTIAGRLDRGWSIEEALTINPDLRNKKIGIHRRREEM